MTPVILSGGSGTRLWPVSRASYPKQFCEFYDQSFLKNTVERLKPFGEPMVLTVASMEALTRRALSEMGIASSRAIYEPFGKNTAPAIALLCHSLISKGMSDEIVGVFPADHLVSDTEAFARAVRLGVACAEKGEIVTLGIEPGYAATGYGYIEVTDQVLMSSGDDRALVVAGFREKPDLESAQKFINSGKHYWNAGMFLFRVSVMVEHIQKFLPQVWAKISQIKPDLSDAKYAYALIEGISLDYGIMEKLPRQICIPCDIGWSDVGSWDELARLAEERPHLRTDSRAQIFPVEAQDNYVFSFRNKVIGLVGVHDLIVVETSDALLITRKGESQKVKELVDDIKRAGSPVATDHPFETRPWGGFEILADGSQFKAKSIQVDPGAQLSYQSHEKRDEHWIVIEGEAEVTLDDVAHRLSAGQHIFIPRNSKHRVRNPGNQRLLFVEVQTGSYFGEDDITRYQDDYGRAPNP